MPDLRIERILLVLIIIMLVASPTSALEVMDRTRITTNSGGRDPVWSPDGNTIAYTSGAYDIWTMQANGRDKRQLTNDIYRDEDPAWSPDGKKIAYVSEHDGSQQLWMMNEDGTGKRQLTFTDGWKSAPSWSPDGNTIAYVSGQYPDYDIWTMNPDGTGQKRITYSENEDWAPAWSPDGKKIAYISKQSGNFDLWIMDADGTNKMRIVEDVYWREPQISWSPDGNTIAYVSGQYPDYDIWTSNVDGTRQKRLTSYSYTQLAPAWSPDGNAIAYTSDESGSYEIWVVDFQIPIAIPPAEINPAPTSYSDATPDTPWVDSVPIPIIAPSEAPQIFEDELTSKDDSTTQQTDKESTRHKDLSEESFEENEELSIPKPDENNEEIIVPASYGEREEIRIPETDKGFGDGIEPDPILTMEKETPQQIIADETSPSKDWRDERFLIALLLTIPFAVMIFDSRYFTIKMGVDFRPSVALSHHLALCLPAAVFMTLRFF